MIIPLGDQKILAEIATQIALASVLTLVITISDLTRMFVPSPSKPSRLRLENETQLVRRQNYWTILQIRLTRKTPQAIRSINSLRILQQQQQQQQQHLYLQNHGLHLDEDYLQIA